jgi:hypothetical protein
MCVYMYVYTCCLFFIYSTGTFKVNNTSLFAVCFIVCVFDGFMLQGLLLSQNRYRDDVHTSDLNASRATQHSLQVIACLHTILVFQV